MKLGPEIAAGAVVLAVAGRLVRRRLAAKRGGADLAPGGEAAGAAAAAGAASEPAGAGVADGAGGSGGLLGRRRAGRVGSAVGLVAAREMRERFRSRYFIVGTVIALALVTAGIVVPVAVRGHRGVDRVGVVGGLSVQIRAAIEALGPAVGSTVTVVPEPSADAATAAVRSGELTLAVVDGSRIVVKAPIAAGDTSGPALLTAEVARVVALQEGLERAGLTPAAAARLAHPAPLPVRALEPSTVQHSTARVVALYGIILTFVLLSQYGTWVLMGVVEEKASRVVEVLLATVRPGQLLTGKVAGIGAVGFTQAAVLVGFALVLAEAVNSPILHGAALASVAMALLWVVLAYLLYCWVYAAGGSLAERQEHVQSLVFPLQLPVLAGYIVGLTAASSGHASLLVKVLAFVPPTAPFCVPVLVALGAMAWWQVVLAVLVTLVATVGVARFAAGVYARAILRTGQRVRLRSVLGSASP